MSKEGHKAGAMAAGKARSKSRKSGNKSGGAGSAGATMSTTGYKWLTKESGSKIRVRKVFM